MSTKMASIQLGTYDLSGEISKKFMDNMVLLKMDTFSDEMDKLSERVATIEKDRELWEKSIYQTSLIVDERQRRTKGKRENNFVNKNDIQDCKIIIDRTLEILADWSETQDIKLQIQYAAVIVGKIENIKKTDYINSNNVRRKICTLLRNVIRINFTDFVFSEEQILLLKKGFLLLLSDRIQKKDMLQLNRELLAQQMMTMPAWE